VEELQRQYFGADPQRIREDAVRFLEQLHEKRIVIIDAGESVSSHCRDHSSLSVALRLLFQSAGTGGGKLRIENGRLVRVFAEAAQMGVLHIH